MITFLEKILYEKTKGSQSEILFAQWNYDKKVVPVALNAVSVLFPHYSLHDETHSKTIINNIVRIMGKGKIENLSAIDIWMILESSYYHDIGMVVSNEIITETISAEDFLHFFKEIQLNKTNGLYDFANMFNVESGKLKYKSNELNLEYHDGIKFILAEYFRKKHSDRSKNIIVNPRDEIELSSPRGVISPRIFKILAEICSCHTKSFDDVMKLPFSEVGIDIEDSHPRFIASLLRIGDLLDLDNNRFSDVMLRTLSKIPIETLRHKAKHLSIESFRADSEIIDVRAKCKDYDTANITQHWFNYLNSEISQQMINWNKIVPYKDLGYLPTIGCLQVELLNYEYIDGRKKPKFSVDTDRALELLQGAGIYEGSYQCIREMLQNAVDATLIRIWIEHGDELDLSHPNSNDFQNIRKKFPITISIQEESVVGGDKSWSIVIEDKGTGVSTDELSYLVNTGSSSKNINKIRLTDGMPIWLRPSGVFGIGFQSIFMLTEQVIFETKSFFTEELQIIELNSPNSKKDGGILVQKIKTNHKRKPGTKLIFSHKIRAIPERYSIKGEQKTASRIAHNYDPFSHDSLDIDLGKIIDEIFDFSLKSYIPVKLFINSEAIEMYERDNKFQFYEEKNAIEFNIFCGKKDNRWRTLTFYKNQIAENNLSFKFIGLEINLHKDKASNVLTLNRNKIKPEYNSELVQQILTGLFEIFTSRFDDVFESKDSKCLGSMFLNYYKNKYDFLSRFDISKYTQWEKLQICIGGENYEIKNLLLNSESLKLLIDKDVRSNYGDIYKIDENDKKQLIIQLRSGNPDYDYTTYLLEQFGSIMTNFKVVKSENNNETEVILTKGEQESPIDKSRLSQILNDLTENSNSSRCIIPCVKEYFNLRLKPDAHEGYVYHYDLYNHLNFKFPKMLSPYASQQDEFGNVTRIVSLNNRVYDWVYKNRFYPEVSIQEIKESYQKFISEYGDL